MKKTFIICLAITLSTLLSAQDLPMFGLDFGKSYTKSQIQSAVGKTGESTIEEYAGLKMNGISFSDISYNGLPCTVVYMTIGEESKLAGIAIDYDREVAGDDINVLYNTVKRNLSQKCDSLTDEVAEDNYTVNAYMDNDKGLFIVMVKVGTGMDTEKFVTAYLDATLMNAMSGSQESNGHDIQDTFFGLKFGTKVTKTQITAAIGTKGEFLNENHKGTNHEYIFKDCVFAGRIWDFASFTLAIDGTFMSFIVYDSMDDYSDERKDAKALYDSYKVKLEDKYGQGREAIDGYDYSVIFSGDNSVGMSLSNSRSRSSGGEYRRYVTLTYLDLAVNKRASQAADDEL